MTDLTVDVNNVEKVDSPIMDEKEIFLQKLSPEMRVIVEQRLRKKEREKNEVKDKAKKLADVTREMLEEEYITFDDGTSFTINELLVSRATANALKSGRTTFRDLNDAQKVMDNDTVDNRNGFTLILNTNGQDLGT